MREPPENDFSAYLVQKISETTLEDLTSHPAQFKFMANYIPLAGEGNCVNCAGCEESVKPRDGEPLYFDCIANKSGGKKLLGYLKADVDNLGSLFAYGLGDDLQDRNSISRLATLSRMLDLFFSGRIEQLLSIEYTDCYSVFSGGDDLLIIGRMRDYYGTIIENISPLNSNIVQYGLAFPVPARTGEVAS